MILFLDFDGVLHPEPCFQDVLLFCHMPKLEAVLRDLPAVEVVISSSWRKGRTLEQLQIFFSPEIRKQIIGMTPAFRDHRELVDVIGDYPRQVEIEAWRRAAGRLADGWVAIDDCAHWFQPSLQNLVVCDPKTGMTDTTAIELWARLRGMF
ncbi:MAG: HAD domain-containing protein [Burkholderiaceae bacterium]